MTACDRECCNLSTPSHTSYVKDIMYFTGEADSRNLIEMEHSPMLRTAHRAVNQTWTLEEVGSSIGSELRNLIVLHSSKGVGVARTWCDPESRIL